MDNRKQEQETRQIISDRFRAYWGKKERSWDIPDGLTPTKAARAAQKAAAEWEQNAKAECEAERKTPKRKRKRAIDRTKSDVADFPENTWFPHCVCQGEHKRTTVEFFEIS